MPGVRRERRGVVVSNKMDKTVVVRVDSRVEHPLYKKTVRRTKKFKAHDDHNVCHVGDTVQIIETRPYSKDKRWRVRDILIKAKRLN